MEQCLRGQAIEICIDCAQQKQQVSFRILVLPSISLNRKQGNFKYQSNNEMVRKETAVNEKKRRKIPMAIFSIKKYL